MREHWRFDNHRSYIILAGSSILRPETLVPGHLSGRRTPQTLCLVIVYEGPTYPVVFSKPVECLGSSSSSSSSFSKEYFLSP